MEYKKKEKYVSPQIEVIPVETEGNVMVSSGGLKELEYDPGWNNSVSRNRQYNAASGSDLEDLINDILTVEQ